MAAANIKWTNKKRPRCDSETLKTLTMSKHMRLEDRASRGFASLSKNLEPTLESRILPLYANSRSFLSPWRGISTDQSSTIKSLKDLLYTVWNSQEYRIRKLVPILSEINEMIGLGNIKEWVTDIVSYFITEGYRSLRYDMEMYTITLSGSSRYVTNLITRLYQKLGIPLIIGRQTTIRVDVGGSNTDTLWSFDIPRYTTKQLYEIFVKILHREGWQIDFVKRLPEMFDCLTTTKDVSLIVRLCKLQKVTTNYDTDRMLTSTTSSSQEVLQRSLTSQEVLQRRLSVTDLAKALEIYRKTKRAVYYQ